ncbi:hypothetical protein ACTHQ7_07385 [Microbacterium enclense]
MCRVHLTLPTTVYLAIERKATAEGVTAGRLCAAYLTRLTAGQAPDGPVSRPQTKRCETKTPVAYKVTAITIHVDLPRPVYLVLSSRAARDTPDGVEKLCVSIFEKVTGAPPTIGETPRSRSGRPRAVDSMPPERLLKLKDMIRRRVPLQEIASAFEVSSMTISRWRGYLLESGEVVLERRRTRERGAPKRSYVRITEDDIPIISRMVRNGASTREVADRFGICLASARTWTRKIQETDKPTPHEFDFDPPVRDREATDIRATPLIS